MPAATAQARAAVVQEGGETMNAKTLNVLTAIGVGLFMLIASGIPSLTLHTLTN